MLVIGVKVRGLKSLNLAHICIVIKYKDAIFYLKITLFSFIIEYKCLNYM